MLHSLIANCVNVAKSYGHIIKRSQNYCRHKVIVNVSQRRVLQGTINHLGERYVTAAATRYKRIVTVLQPWSAGAMSDHAMFYAIAKVCQYNHEMQTFYYSFNYRNYWPTFIHNGKHLYCIICLLTPSHTHTRTHAHTYTRARTHAHTHTLTQHHLLRNLLYVELSDCTMAISFHASYQQLYIGATF